MPGNYSIYVLAAYLIDLAVGDPRWLPHPVVLIGKTIEKLECLTRRFAKSPFSLQAAGVLTAALIAGGSWLTTFLLVSWCFKLNFWAGSFLSVWLISTTIAAKGLAGAAGEIFALLKAGDLPAARAKVGMIVGRDTGEMDMGSVTRATVETVAENIVDGIVSPVFYAFIGGAPLAMAYRAVNTLDSMLGYKNERYINFGMASARLDDLANYIPARITGILLVTAAFLLRMNPQRALAAILRDAPAHPSPNSGIPESAVAGALGIRLGGLNYYGGRASFRPYMGEDRFSLEPAHIVHTVKLMYLASGLAVTAGTIISALVIYFTSLLI
ncbi:adenosylcobinamide-phosphate synthase CbiB [Pelotomaculum propionicicum]|uniref:Cobalamin biosynthesis protein CobD n=1 Tax=Pelotomaculum propionicicum TaxID=258475 RepID=A0A4Y7RUF3_9FIRM|nr:adenosylcobinamide-phosphate synthase CbiB [Pelotomaculum propionicicum]NLI12679.1 cobalamin biosynthesis protein CobD [Peptococcaceae bacterium]TEB12605.1 Cobalamin biosynthesis protein CobD [Pelotomaculum propionicicum]